MPPQPTQTVRPPRGIIPALAALVAFGPLSIDMYLPSLPTLAAEFDAPAGRVQLTLSVFLLGFALGPLVYGPLSDRYGRRPVLLAGTAAYVVTSVLCALSPGLYTLVAARLLQALGGSAGVVVARAVVRDLYQMDAAARVASLMTLMTGLAPLAAPIIGGQVLLWLGWRAIFWVLAGFGLVCLLVVSRFVPETHPPERRLRVTPRALAGGYWRVLRHREATGYMLAAGLAFAGMFAFITGSPFVYIELFGVSPQHYGLLFGLNVVGLMLGATLNSRLTMRLGSRLMLSAGTALLALAGLGLLGAVWSGWGGLPGIVVPLFFYVGSLSLIGSNAMARAMHQFPDIAGTAAAVFGAGQFGLGVVSAFLLSLLQDGTAWPMALVIAVCGVAGLAADVLLTRPGFRA